MVVAKQVARNQVLQTSAKKMRETRNRDDILVKMIQYRTPNIHIGRLPILK
ncbi:hypothetical protein EVA_08093 [gut metagenome]|uniref:Uncharacterized protein n=1 Tax=gut metagenome TaxID=749906 RepID=J9G968_9ZZZZ